MKKLIYLLLILWISSCKKEYVGPEVVITAKRTNYYNGGGAVLPYREISDTIVLRKEQIEKANRSLEEFILIENEIKKVDSINRRNERERKILNYIRPVL